MKYIPYLFVALCIQMTIFAVPEYNPHALGGWAISQELFMSILDIVPEGGTILELGSGTGTGELSRYYTIYSIEHNQAYLNLYDSTYIYAPIKEYEHYQWYDRNEIMDKLPLKYDLILVDGPPGHIGREGFLHNIDLFNTNVPIIFDDVQRHAEGKLLQEVSTILQATPIIIKSQEGKSFGIIQKK